jgi:hypothetical protein
MLAQQSVSVKADDFSGGQRGVLHIAQAKTAGPTQEESRVLVGKWEYDENRRFYSKFEIKTVENNEARDIDFTVGGRSVDTKARIWRDEQGRLRVKIPLQQGVWELTYVDARDGVLDGTLTLGGFGPITGKFYRVK